MKFTKSFQIFRRASQHLFWGLSVLLVKTVRWSWRNSRIVLSLFLLATVFLFLQMGKMKIIFSPEDLAGQGIPAADEIKSIKARYDDGVSSILVVSPADGQRQFTARESCAIRKWYSITQASSTDFRNTSSSFDLAQPQRLNSESVGIANIINLDCQHEKWRVDPEEIRIKLNKAPWALAGQSFESKTLGYSFVFTYRDATNSRFGTFDPQAVQRLRESVERYLMPIIPGAKLQWIGPADYQWYVLEGFAFSKYVNLGMIILLVVLLRMFFGTWKSGLIYSFSLITCGVWVFGLKGAFGSSYDVLSTGLFLILGISSLEDFVFVSGEQMRGRSWRSSVRVMIVSSFFTSLTTIVGFLSLCLSDMEAVKRLGLWAAVGALVEWCIIVIVVPCALKEFKNLKTWVMVDRSRGFWELEKIVTKVPRLRWCFLSLVIFPLAVIAFNTLNFNESPHKLFPEDHQYSKDLQLIEKSKGWIGSVGLVFAKRMSRQGVEHIVGTLRKTPEGAEMIRDHQSPSRLIDWLLVEKIYVEDEILALLSNSTAYRQMVDAEERPRVQLFLNNVSVEAINRLSDRVNKICSRDCHLSGDLVAYSEFAGYVPKTLMDSLAMSLMLVAFIIAFLCLAFDKLKILPSILLSSFWGPLAMIAILGLTQSVLDFWRSLFASILVGLAGDNAIQYLFASRKVDLLRGIDERGSASVITNTLMALTSLVYLGSYFNPPKAFGLILCSGLFLCLIGDLWLLRAYLKWSQPAWDALTQFFKRKSGSEKAVKYFDKGFSPERPYLIDRYESNTPKDFQSSETNP